MKTTLFSIALVMSSTLFSQDFVKIMDQNLFMLHLSESTMDNGKAELIERYPDGIIYIDVKDTFQIEVGENEAYQINKQDGMVNLSVNFFTNNKGIKEEMLRYFNASKEFEIMNYEDKPDYVQAESNWMIYGIQDYPEDETFTFLAIKLNKKDK